MVPDTRPADIGWAVIVLGGLAYDVWLDRRGHALLTHRARTRAGKVVQGVLIGHFAGVLPGPLDPFNIVCWLASIRRKPSPC